MYLFRGLGRAASVTVHLRVPRWRGGGRDGWTRAAEPGLTSGRLPAGPSAAWLSEQEPLSFGSRPGPAGLYERALASATAEAGGAFDGLTPQPPCGHSGPAGARGLARLARRLLPQRQDARHLSPPSLRPAGPPALTAGPPLPGCAPSR